MEETLVQWNRVISFFKNLSWYQIISFTIIYLGLVYLWIAKIVEESWKKEIDEIISEIKKGSLEEKYIPALEKKKSEIGLNPKIIKNMYHKIRVLEKTDKNVIKGKYSEKVAASIKLSVIL